LVSIKISAVFREFGATIVTQIVCFILSLFMDDKKKFKPTPPFLAIPPLFQVQKTIIPYFCLILRFLQFSAKTLRW
jgi:hypothetical protein